MMFCASLFASKFSKTCVKTSVLMSTSVECMIGSKPKSLITFCFMICIIADILQFVEWFLKVYFIN